MWLFVSALRYFVCVLCTCSACLLLVFVQLRVSLSSLGTCAVGCIVMSMLCCLCVVVKRELCVRACVCVCVCV